jgi:hypothetical protein
MRRCVAGWLLTGSLSVRATEGWREVHHDTAPYATRESCEAAITLLRTKALDDAYAISDDLRCVKDASDAQ